MYGVCKLGLMTSYMLILTQSLLVFQVKCYIFSLFCTRAHISWNSLQHLGIVLFILIFLIYPLLCCSPSDSDS